MDNSGWTTVTKKSPKGPKTRAMRKKVTNNRERKKPGIKNNQTTEQERDEQRQKWKDKS